MDLGDAERAWRRTAYPTGGLRRRAHAGNADEATSADLDGPLSRTGPGPGREGGRWPARHRGRRRVPRTRQGRCCGPRCGSATGHCIAPDRRVRRPGRRAPARRSARSCDWSVAADGDPVHNGGVTGSPQLVLGPCASAPRWCSRRWRGSPTRRTAGCAASRRRAVRLRDDHHPRHRRAGRGTLTMLVFDELEDVRSVASTAPTRSTSARPRRSSARSTASRTSTSTSAARCPR